MSTTEPPAPTHVNPAAIEHVKSPQYRTVYANNTRATSSPIEMRITFSHIADKMSPDGKQGFVNEEEVCVIVHPAAIRNMLALIEQTLTNHEKLWGPITPPTGIGQPTVVTSTSEK